MSFTFCVVSGAIIQKAGANASSSVTTSGSMLANFSDYAEGIIIAETRRNWLNNYSTLISGMKWILADCATDLAAMKVINYDMSGYTSRAEAQTMLDVLKDNANKNMQTLKDFKSNEIKEIN